MKKVTIALLSLIGSCIATDELAEIDLHKPVYYHKEVIIMSVCKQFGGLYLQIEDAPFSLRKTPYFAPKMKTRSINNKRNDIVEPAPSVFGFIKGLNERNVR